MTHPRAHDPHDRTAIPILAVCPWLSMKSRAHWRWGKEQRTQGIHSWGQDQGRGENIKFEVRWRIATLSLSQADEQIMQNQIESNSPVKVNGALLLGVPTMLQSSWPKSHWCLCILQMVARDQDINKLILNHHRFGGAHPQTQISCRANQMSPSPFQTHFMMLTSKVPPTPGRLACCIGKGKKYFPQSCFSFSCSYSGLVNLLPLSCPWILSQILEISPASVALP